MNAKTPRDWRELCRRAAEEMDPDKLMELVVEINQCLDEHIKKRKGVAENVTDTEGKAKSRPGAMTLLKIRQTCQPLAYLSSIHQSRSLRLA